MAQAPLLDDQLLATKLFIPVSAHAVLQRPRLATLLDQSLHRPLTVVAAPAGFGKTTLVAAWLRAMAEHTTAGPPAPAVAWLSLEESDDQPARFWRYLLAALDTCLPGSAAPFVAYLQAGGEPGLPMLTGLVNFLLSAEISFLLVLDDYHLITSPSIQTSLTFLIEHLPPHVHVLVLTRDEPKLPLARLRARGQLLELRSDHLRCTDAEAAAFLRQVMGVQLDATTVTEVTKRTEGWLVGLQLLGLWLQTQDGRADVTDELRGSHHYILDYVTDEVVRRLDAETRSFLSQTSILDRLSGPLCDAVTEETNSDARLATMARANLFLEPLDAQRRWYRYHPLFAEAVRHRLEQEQPEQAAALRLRASRWYAEGGRLEEAVAYGLAARAWPWAAELIAQLHAGSGSAIGERWRLRAWLQQLPQELVRSQPRLSLAHAQAMLTAAPASVVEPWLASVEERLRAAANPESLERGLLGETLATRAFKQSLEGDWQVALATSAEALLHLNEQHDTLRANVAYTQSVAHASAGDMLAAADHAQQAAGLAQSAGNVSSAALYLANTAQALMLGGRLRAALQVSRQALTLGEAGGMRLPAWPLAAAAHADVLRELGQLDRAQELVDAAHELNGRGGARGFDITISLVAARVARSAGDLGAALAAVERAERAVPEIGRAATMALLLVDAVLIMITAGQVARAGHWLEQQETLSPPNLPLARQRAALARARLLLAQGQPTEGLELLRRLAAEPMLSRRGGDQIALTVGQTLGYQQLGDHERALAALRAALLLAEPEGYVSIIADEGPMLSGLIGRLRAQHGGQHLDALIRASQGRPAEPVPRSPTVSQSPVAPGAVLAEPLSARELEVLRLAVAGASNQEIADRLVLSINTVKRHMGNIFAKLDATNRTQAVARARALGLLGDHA